jgi:hypothetical protein
VFIEEVQADGNAPLTPVHDKGGGISLPEPAKHTMPDLEYITADHENREFLVPRRMP